MARMEPLVAHAAPVCACGKTNAVSPLPLIRLPGRSLVLLTVARAPVGTDDDKVAVAVVPSLYSRTTAVPVSTPTHGIAASAAASCEYVRAFHCGAAGSGSPAASVTYASWAVAKPGAATIVRSENCPAAGVGGVSWISTMLCAGAAPWHRA